MRSAPAGRYRRPRGLRAHDETAAPDPKPTAAMPDSVGPQCFEDFGFSVEQEHHGGTVSWPAPLTRDTLGVEPSCWVDELGSERNLFIAGWYGLDGAQYDAVNAPLEDALAAAGYQLTEDANGILGVSPGPGRRAADLGLSNHTHRWVLRGHRDVQWSRLTRTLCAELGRSRGNRWRVRRSRRRRRRPPDQRDAAHDDADDAHDHQDRQHDREERQHDADDVLDPAQYRCRRAPPSSRWPQVAPSSCRRGRRATAVRRWRPAPRRCS